jgi:lysophospholipase L1-like esterase
MNPEKYYTTLISVCCFVCGCFAQAPAPAYKFMKMQENKLYFSSDSTSFLNLFERISKVPESKNDRVSIVHIGGSHVQGGTWSNTFVSAFQEKYITAGGGFFLFPYRLAKTNGPPFSRSFGSGTWKRCRAVGKEFCLPLGMSALSVSTSDSVASFGMVLTRKAACKMVTTVKVYHNFNPSYHFRPLIHDTIKMEREDRESEGFTRFTFVMPLDSFSFNLARIDSVKSNADSVKNEFVLYGLSLENDLAPGFYLATLGANGASTSSFLRSSHFVSQFRTIRADLVILSLGVNDTQSKGFAKEDFIENYDTLITLIRSVHPEAAIILTTTTDNYIRRKTSNKRTIAARVAMFELMERHNIAVWDLFTVMGGYRSMPKWFAAGLASRDRVHFTSKGYSFVGMLMFDAFQRAYENSLKKQP